QSLRLLYLLVRITPSAFSFLLYPIYVAIKFMQCKSAVSRSLFNVTYMSNNLKLSHLSISALFLNGTVNIQKNPGCKITPSLQKLGRRELFQYGNDTKPTATTTQEFLKRKKKMQLRQTGKQLVLQVCSH
uniref:Uncharacterized protein n=1 Tax=Stegastes partitus TaxID=144197 RepID=A0A3B4ZD19_9TELE